MSNGERIVEANGVQLNVETFGAASDPTILLIHGASASMLWWESELCERIAASGRHVVRFDNRDTGRSVSYPPGQPGYSLHDMAGDALGVLDALDIRRAHLVGRSMAGAIALIAAEQSPDRVASLTLVTTSPGDPDLPSSSSDVARFTSAGGPDPNDRPSVVDFIVKLMALYSGPSPYFDESHVRSIAEADLDRTANIASCLINHFVIDTSGKVDFAAIQAPTLVVHGEQDPVFPLAHGQALHQKIAGSRLLVLEKAGHELPPAVWDTFVPALVEHTSR